MATEQFMLLYSCESFVGVAHTLQLGQPWIL